MEAEGLFLFNLRAHQTLFARRLQAAMPDELLLSHYVHKEQADGARPARVEQLE